MRRGVVVLADGGSMAILRGLGGMEAGGGAYTCSRVQHNPTPMIPSWDLNISCA